MPKIGNDHYDIAQGYEWYAEVYKAMGDTASAAENYRKAIEIYEKRDAAARSDSARKKLEALEK